jgi:hypothetical protein
MSTKPTPPALIAGPYNPPACEPGSSLTCKRFGRQTVGGFTAAPIPWPYAARIGGTPPLILCGDLVRAIRTETASAVAFHWGVNRSVVHDWRQVLGVGRFTAGTKLRWQELAKKKLTPEINRKAQAASVAARRANKTSNQEPTA